MEVVFIICIGWVAYVYVGYPLLVMLLAILFRSSPIKKAFQPSVTILIPAYNEKEHIAATIENKLSLNYPKDKIQIIVISDESEDGTDDIVQSYADKGVQLVRQEPRRGKTSGLNLAVPKASGEILVFSDANSIYDVDALLYMMENFSDKSVGYVTGKMVYTNSNGAVIGDGCGAYMRYENFIRKHETLLNSVVGVDGGVDAVRRELYQPMNADQLPDFVLPLNVVEQGRRVVYEERALLKEDSLSSTSSEYRMRVRVSLRAMWALLDKRALLNPVRFPVFGWELISHKLLRYLIFIPQLLLVLLNLMLLADGAIYWLFALLQAVFYMLAYMGYLAEREGKHASFVMTLPYYFVVVNAASAQAFWMFLKGNKVVLWTPRVG